jgi:hypothetical protein
MQSISSPITTTQPTQGEISAVPVFPAIFEARDAQQNAAPEWLTQNQRRRFVNTRQR